MCISSILPSYYKINKWTLFNFNLKGWTMQVLEFPIFKIQMNKTFLGKNGWRLNRNIIFKNSYRYTDYFSFINY